MMVRNFDSVFIAVTDLAKLIGGSREIPAEVVDLFTGNLTENLRRRRIKRRRPLDFYCIEQPSESLSAFEIGQNPCLDVGRVL